MARLFSAPSFGSIPLGHRVVMAPLTRNRANDEHVHGDLAVEYYSQRASYPGTLIITEATFISPRGGGYPNVPGIWNKEQIAAWKKVTDAVHAKGSFIFLQLWALGRTASPAIVKSETGDENAFMAPSALPYSKEAAVPREMTEKDIWTLIGDYAQGAKNSIEAGFDGVEIHGANGYLIDQFIEDMSNHRTDAWGGSIEKRARFAIEVAKAVTAAIGPEKVGMRLSPFSPFQGMKMEDPVPQFSAVVRVLKELNLLYIHMVESRVSGNADVEATAKIDFALEIWGKEKPFLIAGGLKPDSAKRAIEEEYKDYNVFAVFGRNFIANPDLPFRILKGISLNPYNRDTFYKAKSPEGYIDYPFSKEFEAQANL